MAIYLIPMAIYLIPWIIGGLSVLGLSFTATECIMTWATGTRWLPPNWGGTIGFMSIMSFLTFLAYRVYRVAILRTTYGDKKEQHFK